MTVGAPAPSLLDAALELAGEGFAVFPCGLDKAPRTAHGFHDATRDPEAIAAWEWDGTMLGIAIPEGCVILDVDPRNGGDATLRSFLQPLPHTCVVQTGGGGQHYYFTVAANLELKSTLGAGVDIKRAGKGYVIAPPSPGYTYLTQSAPAPLPAWLIDELRIVPKEQRSNEGAAPKFFAKFEEGTAYGLAARDRQLGRLVAAGAGERNNALNAAAFSLAQLVAGGELAADSTRALLEGVAHRVGLEEREIERTIQSGWDAGLAEPWQALPRDEAEPYRERYASDTEDFWLDWSVDEPEPEFLCDPILPEHAYVLVYGPAAASKSMVFAALGAEASRNGYRTTVYSLENPPHIDRHRLRRLHPDKDFFRQSNEPLDMNDPAQFEAMVKREKEWQPHLIVIDTYSHAFESRSEDGNARAIAFARRIRYLMHETGATVVVIDHTGYMQEGEPRDASAKRQQVDVAVLMTPIGTWAPGKPSLFRMENRKASRFGNPFLLNGEIRDREDKTLWIKWNGSTPEWVTNA